MTRTNSEIMGEIEAVEHEIQELSNRLDFCRNRLTRLEAELKPVVMVKYVPDERGHAAALSTGPGVTVLIRDSGVSYLRSRVNEWCYQHGYEVMIWEGFPDETN